MSTEAVKWAMDDAPMLRTSAGKPDTTARHVLQTLAEHARADGSNAHPSALRIRYRTGYDAKTVERALSRLEKAGLIKRDGAVQGRTRWRLNMALVRPEFDWSELEAEEEAQRQAAAERVRRHREKRRVTDSAPVAVTDSAPVTEDGVTDSASVRNGRKVRYVTDSASVRNGLSARYTGSSPAETPAESGAVTTITTTINPLSQAEQIIRDAAVVAPGDEREFIDWVTAKHNPRGPGWWRTVAANGDLADHAATWHAERHTTQSASSRLPPWCGHCGDGSPAARTEARYRLVYDDRGDGHPCPHCHPTQTRRTA